MKLSPCRDEMFTVAGHPGLDLRLGIGRDDMSLQTANSE